MPIWKTVIQISGETLCSKLRLPGALHMPDSSHGSVVNLMFSSNLPVVGCSFTANACFRRVP